VQAKPEQATTTRKFFNWAYLQGDKAATELEYVPLPDHVKELVRTQWAQVKDAAGKPVAFK